MTSRRSGPLLSLLSLLLAACVSAPPPPPAEVSPSPAVSPTAVATPPVSPAPATQAPLPSLTPAGTIPPSPSPTLAPPPSPTVPITPSPQPTVPVGPTASPPVLDARLERQLTRALEAERTARGIPGMSAVVVFGDGSRWAAATGDADLDSGRPVEPETPFVVGSITKTFVAALVLQLAEEGLLDLDAPLAQWLPEQPGASGIRLRHLLAHTSGLFNYFEHPRYNSIVFGGPEESWTPQEVLERFQRPPYFAPGEGFYYSNTGFVLLGLVIEEATGNSLGHELRTRFFEPLGMKDTYFQGDGPPPPTAAEGYLRRESGYREVSDGSGYRPTTSAATVAWAAGGIVSSAPDIATWGRALYGGELLQPDSLDQMIDVNATPHSRGTYGLGTRTRFLSGARAFGHTGSLRGFMGAVWHMPNQEMTVVVLTNLGRIDANVIADRLAAVAMGRR